MLSVAEDILYQDMNFLQSCWPAVLQMTDRFNILQSLLKFYWIPLVHKKNFQVA